MTRDGTSISERFSRPPPRLPAVLLALSFLLLVSPPAALASAWSRTYGGSSADEAFAVREVPAGGYIVAGRTASFGAGRDDAWLLRLDTAGNVVWQRTYGGTDDERFHAVYPTSDGGFIATGYQDSFTGAMPGNESLWVVKVTSTGTVQWEKTLGATQSVEQGNDVQELAGGGYLVAGRTSSFGAGGLGDGWLINLDPNGNALWDQTYDYNNGTDAFYEFDVMPGGGLVAAGETDGHMSVVPGDNDFFVITTGPTGAFMQGWHDGGAQMGFSGDSARSVQATSDGGYIVTGETVQGSGAFDFWIVKASAIGFVQWQEFFGASGFFSLARAVRETLDRGYIVAGSRAFATTEGILLKLDPNGMLQWHHAYGSPNGLADFSDVRATADGGYVAAGRSDASGNVDVWVVKTDHNGEIDPGCTAVTVPSMTLGMGGPMFPPGLGVSTPPASHSASSTSATAGTTVAASSLRCPVPARVNQDAGIDSQQEVALAIDPANSKAQVAAYVDDPDPSTSGGVQKPDIGVSFTTDGGASWTDRQVGFGCNGLDDDMDGFTDEETLCDGLDDDGDFMADEDPCCVLEHFHPSAGSDLAGNFYTAYLAQQPGALTGAGTSVIGAAKSTDGGSTWSALPPAAYVPYGPDLLPPFGIPDTVVNLDNPALAVERNQGMPASATIMAVWQQENPSTAMDTDVYASSLASGAPGWTTPAKVNDQALACSEMPVASWAPGVLWVAWRQSFMQCGMNPQIYVDQSFDNGQTFNPFGPDLPGPSYTQAGMLRNHTFQPGDRFAFAADPLNPNVLYLAFVSRSGGADEADVLFTKSINGGNMWEAPVQVNDDLTVTPQYAPSITVKANANAWTLVDVTWYDERNSIGCDGMDDDFDGRIDEERTNGVDDDGDFLIDEDICDVRVDVYMARTANTAGVMTFFSPNVRVTASSFLEPGTPFPATIGEYLGSGSDLPRTYVAWTDTRNGDNDIYRDTVTDIDFDGDGMADGLDCSPADPAVRLKPLEVLNLAPTQTVMGNTQVAWTSEDPVAGAATRYDIVSGLASQLALDGDFRSSACLVDDHPDTPYTDTRGNPPAGDAYYYVIRAVNPCGSGTYGNPPSGPSRAGLEDGAASLPYPDPCP